MDTNLNMQRMPIDRLKPAKYNPRKDLQPGDPAYEKIKRSLHDFGYVDPIVWNEVTGNIVGGHQPKGLPKWTALWFISKARRMKKP